MVTLTAAPIFHLDAINTMFVLAHTEFSPSLGGILANRDGSNGKSLSGVSKCAELREEVWPESW